MSPALSPNLNAFNYKLFVAAQKGYIKSLLKQEKEAEAKKRIDLVIKELSKMGLNYRIFKEEK